MKDFYKILEVSDKAKSDEIKKSYRRLAFKYHPDTNDGSKHMEAKFKQLAEAYGVLSNPKDRKQYDNDLKKPIQKSTYNSQAKYKQAKKQQPLSPAVFLQIMININLQLSQLHYSRIDKENFYDLLIQLLSDENINFLLSCEDKKTNLLIIDEVLHCCKTFGKEKHPIYDLIYIEQIAKKLTPLAGNDKKAEQRILKFVKQGKYHKRTGERRGFIAVIFLLIIIVLFIIIATYKNN